MLIYLNTYTQNYAQTLFHPKILVTATHIARSAQLTLFSAHICFCHRCRVFTKPPPAQSVFFTLDCALIKLLGSLGLPAWQSHFSCGHEAKL